MKSFLMTIGSLILMLTIWYFSSCFSSFNQHNEKLRFVAEEAAIAGTLYEKVDEFSQGVTIFNDVESLAAVKDVVCRNMDLDSSMDPRSGSYWTNTVSITAYILDDQSCRVYKDGVLINEITFAYPYLLTVEDTGYSHAIARPAVCVSIDAGNRLIGGGFLRVDPHMRRSGAYEIVVER